jgi:hypothetical protein
VNKFYSLAAALTLSACSNAPETPIAPEGAMEGFADQRAADEAGDKSVRVEAARAHDASVAADARQKVQAAESIDRFERTERALEITDTKTGK